MKKLVYCAVLFLGFAVPSFAKTNHAASTHHTIKVGEGVKKVGHVTKKVALGTVFTAYDSLEASVDSVGVALQALADAVDMGVAAPLEALPKPLNEVGVGVHYVYLGIDKAGEFLAK